MKNDSLATISIRKGENGMRDGIVTLRLVVLSMLACCVIYPAVVLFFAQMIVPWQADGSLIADDQGRIVGSVLIAQKFTRPEYFWPRPSAVDYNAAAAGGSNLSPANPKLAERARATIRQYGLEQGQFIPAELVTASGSGLDPHISHAAALYQLPRVSAASGLSRDRLEALINRNTEGAALRVFGGEPLVNVLRLNLELARAAASEQGRK